MSASTTSSLRVRKYVSYRLEQLKMAGEHQLYRSMPGRSTSSYTPFVILFQARTGSNMLRTALHNHPNIRCYRELFRDREQTRRRDGAIGIPQAQLQTLLDEPCTFLDEYLFGPQAKRTQAVGFKLAYGHARESAWLPVWQYLADRQVHVLELRRHDLLAVLCSIERARLTGNFVARSSNAPPSQRPVTISIERCQAFFEGTDRREAEADELFGTKSRSIVYYEDILADWSGQTGLIQDFLGVDRQAVTPTTAKQSQLSASDAIENFDELSKHFQNSKYAHHFNAARNRQ